MISPFLKLHSNSARPLKTYLVTGGAGFIGSNFILQARSKGVVRTVNVDKLTYAGNLNNLSRLKDDPNHVFIRADIGDLEKMRRVLAEHRPDAVVNFAAESHVDRSILGPDAFIQTNVVGTSKLLQAVLDYWRKRFRRPEERFCFLHVSTDEVFGSLSDTDPPFKETTPYDPRSPYSASKAASDHLVRAYHHTYGLPVIVTNCSNNYGPRQFPEKLIPLMILNARAGKPLPVYGDGENVRDWLYVEDHCRALMRVLEKGRVGETYNIGGHSEKTNNDVVDTVCRMVDRFFPDSPHTPHRNLIEYVTDRPGHDWRYAIDTAKIEAELDWRPSVDFESGILRTVEWYLDNEAWIASIQSGEYRRWMDLNYGRRNKDEHGQ